MLSFENSCDLSLLAQVATQKLYDDILPYEEDKVTKINKNCLKKSNLSDVKDKCNVAIDELKVMSAASLLKLYAEADFNEIKKRYSYICRFNPKVCKVKYQSFANEFRAKVTMKNHLLAHVKELASTEDSSQMDLQAGEFTESFSKYSVPFCKVKKKDVNVERTKVWKENENIKSIPSKRHNKNTVSLSEISNKILTPVETQVYKSQILLEVLSKNKNLISNCPPFQIYFEEEHSYSYRFENGQYSINEMEKIIEKHCSDDDSCLLNKFVTESAFNNSESINYNENINNFINCGESAPFIGAEVIISPNQSSKLQVDKKRNVTFKSNFIAGRKPPPIEQEMAINCINDLKKYGIQESGPVCQLCSPSRKFSTYGTLLSHYKSHASIKPYKCHVCNAVFTRKHSLNYHLLIHANRTRFTCDDCGRKFRHPSHFREHVRRHTGEAPYHCEECNIRFKTKNSLKRHVKVHHQRYFPDANELDKNQHKSLVDDVVFFQTSKLTNPINEVIIQTMGIPMPVK